jgi:hypothetical protein
MDQHQPGSLLELLLIDCYVFTVSLYGLISVVSVDLKSVLPSHRVWQAMGTKCESDIYQQVTPVTD